MYCHLRVLILLTKHVFLPTLGALCLFSGWQQQSSQLPAQPSHQQQLAHAHSKQRGSGGSLSLRLRRGWRSLFSRQSHEDEPSASSSSSSHKKVCVIFYFMLIFVFLCNQKFIAGCARPLHRHAGSAAFVRGRGRVKIRAKPVPHTRSGPFSTEIAYCICIHASGFLWRVEC